MDSVIANKPKVISILLGINDLSTGRSPDEIAETYSGIVSALKEALPSAKILVSSVLPVKEKEGIPSEAIQATNEKLKQICTEYEITYVDAFSVLADENNFLREEYAIDTVHLTIEGYLEYLACLDTAFSNSSH